MFSCGARLDTSCYRKVRCVLADGYNETLCLGSMLDQAVRDGKAIHAMVEPLHSQVADPGRANRALTQEFSQYEGLRDTAMDLNQRVQGAGQQLINTGY